MASVREALKRRPMLLTIGKEAKRAFRNVSQEFRQLDWKRARRTTIQRYLASSSEPKLHIGCGPMILDGWLNSDIEPRIDQGVVYVDICEGLPLPSETFKYIYSEHVLEHVTLEQAFEHLKDCRRILLDDGVLRVAMPDLKFLIDYCVTGRLSSVQEQFLNEMIAEFHPTVPVRRPSILLNDFVRRWGHQFIYDRELFHDLLNQAGFSEVRDCAVQESSHRELAGLERHGNAIGDAFNRLQTMVVEARK